MSCRLAGLMIVVIVIHSSASTEAAARLNPLNLELALHHRSIMEHAVERRLACEPQLVVPLLDAWVEPEQVVDVVAAENVACR